MKKIIRQKILPVLLAVLVGVSFFPFTTANADEVPSYNLESGTAVVGEDITLKLNFYSDGNCYAMNFAPVYDKDALEIDLDKDIDFGEYASNVGTKDFNVCMDENGEKPFPKGNYSIKLTFHAKKQVNMK